jgi:gluconokinase
MNLILMGVAGSGKTAVGRKLAAALGGRWRFDDADDFHPPANIEKMSRGVPLDDADRWPWLEAIRVHLDACAARGESVVLACSALKESYRRRLAAARAPTRFVYLRGDPATFRDRLHARPDHYMKAGLLDSQFAALEEPAPGTALVIDAALAPDAIVDRIVGDYRLRQPR